MQMFILKDAVPSCLEPRQPMRQSSEGQLAFGQSGTNVQQDRLHMPLLRPAQRLLTG